MNIVIPAAGRGERFKSSAFGVPKPLIDIFGKPMLYEAIKSLDVDGNYVFIVFDYEEDRFNKKIRECIYESVKRPIVIKINYITQGPASSVLLAKELINNDQPLLTANCDQIMKWESRKFLDKISSGGDQSQLMDGLVVTYFADTVKNSYVKLDGEWAVEFAEKKIISNHSLNGIHFWKQGSCFVDSAESMIKNNVRVNGEFYISESYNELIRDGKRIGIYEIPEEEHCAIGTPEDLKKYLNLSR